MRRDVATVPGRRHREHATVDGKLAQREWRRGRGLVQQAGHVVKGIDIEARVVGRATWGRCWAGRAARRERAVSRARQQRHERRRHVGSACEACGRRAITVTCRSLRSHVEPSDSPRLSLTSACLVSEHFKGTVRYPPNVLCEVRPRHCEAATAGGNDWINGPVHYHPHLDLRERKVV